jgi:hypothetical protein
MMCNPREITCTVAENGRSIEFHPCGVISHNINDVQNKYCARCHRFVSLVDAARSILEEIASDQDKT